MIGTPRLRELNRVQMQRLPSNVHRQYITLPRPSSIHQLTNQGKLSSKTQFKVVLPNAARPCGMLKGHMIKKENLSSKIPAANNPERICEEILQKISRRGKNIDMQEYVDLMIRTTISKKFRAKARLNRTPSTPQNSLSLDNYDKWSKLHHSEILAKCREFENVIERQRAEIDDLRNRLMERKKWEDIWKESLKTFFSVAREKLLKQMDQQESLKEQLNVASAKLKIIEVTKSKHGEDINMLLPSGKFGKSLLRLAGRLSKTKPSQSFPTSQQSQDQVEHPIDTEGDKFIKIERTEEANQCSNISNYVQKSQYLGNIYKNIEHMEFQQPDRKIMKTLLESPINRLPIKRQHSFCADSHNDQTVQLIKRRRPSAVLSTDSNVQNSQQNSPDSGWNSGELSDSSISSPPAYQKQSDDLQPLNDSTYSDNVQLNYNMENTSNVHTHNKMTKLLQSNVTVLTRDSPHLEGNSSQPNDLPDENHHQRHPHHTLAPMPLSAVNSNNIDWTLDRFIGDIFNDIQDITQHNTADISFINPTFSHSAPWEDMDLKEPFLKQSQHDILSHQLCL